MPRNGSGTYTRAGSDYVFNTVIDQAAVNNEMDDIATALTNSLAKNGETTPTANIPMGGFKITGLGAPTAVGDALRRGSLLGPVTARSSDTILAADDCGTTFVATSTFTQTFTAAATLGAGWWVNYRNDGVGAITLDPNGSETIDGSTTVTLSPGSSLTIVCDGSNFKSIGTAFLATQAEQETATSTTVLVTPGRQQFHPSAAKGWCQAQTDGQAASAFNVTSVTDNGTGDATITWGTDFSSGAYCAVSCPVVGFGGTAASTRIGHPIPTSYAAGTTRVQCALASDGTLDDPSYHNVVAFGDQ